LRTRIGELRRPGTFWNGPLFRLRGDTLAVGVLAVTNAHDFDRVVALLKINEAPCSNPEPEKRRIKPFELFDAAGLGLEKTIQGLEKPDGGVAVDRANIGAGLKGPQNAFSY
jgi:hypothetical protein